MHFYFAEYKKYLLPLLLLVLLIAVLLLKHPCSVVYEGGVHTTVIPVRAEENQVILIGTVPLGCHLEDNLVVCPMAPHRPGEIVTLELNFGMESGKVIVQVE